MLILNSLVNMHFGGQLCLIQFIPLYHSSWKKWSFLPLQQSLNCLENPPPFFLEGAACLARARQGEGEFGKYESKLTNARCGADILTVASAEVPHRYGGFPFMGPFMAL